ncbi:MAG: hypothetical protein ACI9H6_000516 [Patiriisocius sp.]|jgi:hypothetical protein
MPDENDIVYDSYGPDLLGIVRAIIDAITGSDVSSDGMFAWFAGFWEIYSIIAFLLSFLFIIGIIYSYIRFGQLSELEASNLMDAENLWKQQHGASQENRRWTEIQRHVASGQPNDWKLSIIEADIILGEELTKSGFPGHSIGEQLKSAGKTGFATVQDAWDAHLIRNKIAHQGADFVLTQGMAKEAMIKYERVFKEFGAV